MTIREDAEVLRREIPSCYGGPCGDEDCDYCRWEAHAQAIIDALDNARWITAQDQGTGPIRGRHVQDSEDWS